MEYTEFAASWSRAVWTTSVTALSILLASITFCVVLGVCARGRDKIAAAIALGLSGLLALCIGGLVVTAPIRYAVNDTNVVVRRIGPDMIIRRVDIVDAQTPTAQDVFRGSLRIWASDGVLGVFGIMRSPVLGYFDVYATRTDTLVLIRRRGRRPVVLSPDANKQFLRAIWKPIRNG